MIRPPSRIVPPVLIVAALLLLAVGVGAARAAPPGDVPHLPLPGPPPPPPPPRAATAAPRTPARRGAARLPVVHAPGPPRDAARHPASPHAGRPVPPPHAAERADVGSVTGLPLPRFASLRSSEVDLRAGPGFRYPIRWVYHRVGLPVEIAREFAVWREVVMPDGTRGWMHEATLAGRRDGIVIDGRHTLRRTAAPDARPVAIVDPGVVLHILHCDARAAWCRVGVASFRGWLPRTDFWGTFSGEQVADR